MKALAYLEWLQGHSGAQLSKATQPVVWRMNTGIKVGSVARNQLTIMTLLVSEIQEGPMQSQSLGLQNRHLQSEHSSRVKAHTELKEVMDLFSKQQPLFGEREVYSPVSLSRVPWGYGWSLPQWQEIAKSFTQPAPGDHPGWFQLSASISSFQLLCFQVSLCVSGVLISQ